MRRRVANLSRPVRPFSPVASLLAASVMALGLAGCSDRLPGDGGVNDQRSDEEAIGSACDEYATYRICDDGLVSFCGEDAASGDLVWGACLEPECFPGDDYTCGTCELDGETPTFIDTCNVPDEGGGTPLVFAFDDQVDHVELMPADAATFDLQDISNCMTTDWPTAETPWLALDRDGNGNIDGGSELFGSGTELADGRKAEHGFEALAELDANGDGRITPADPRFHELVLWSDADADRMSNMTETPSAADVGIVSISLSYDVDATCDARGNCSIEKATFAYLDRHGELRTGKVLDLHLSCY